MKRWIYEHGLMLVNLGLFAVFLAGMAVAGWQVASDDQVAHGESPLSFAAFLASGEFYEAVFENWESEFLQMGAYVVLTAFLFQKGSPESKPLDQDAPQDEDPRLKSGDSAAPWPVRRGGVWLLLYENSLAIMFVVLFIGAFVAHAVSGAAAFSEEQALHGEPGVTAVEYMGTAQFWFESLQNWQSEFMVVALLVFASVWLRQRGSSESKPVAAAHSASG